jgi:hypothetical protein
MVGSCPAKSDGSNSTSTEERFSESTETYPVDNRNPPARRKISESFVRLDSH